MSAAPMTIKRHVSKHVEPVLVFGTAPDSADGWVADRPIKGMTILGIRCCYFSDGSSRRYYLHAAAPPPPHTESNAAPIKAKKLNRKQRRMRARQRRESVQPIYGTRS
jgi:hypothetical protein